jgi:hypothetical protein
MGIAGMEDMAALGIPSRQQLVQSYCRVSNLASLEETVDIMFFYSSGVERLLFGLLILQENCVIVQEVAQEEKLQRREKRASVAISLFSLYSDYLLL